MKLNHKRDQTGRATLIQFLHSGLLAVLLAGPVTYTANGAETLWSIGQKDQSSAELALGAGHPDQDFIHRFPQDPFYIVGQSSPSNDWPAIQPGSYDAWANARAHTFNIIFGMDQAVDGKCRLVLDLVDAQYWSPPEVTIGINGQQLPAQRPANGNGDDTLDNHPEKGRHQSLVFEFPGTMLQTNNLISIKTDNGSWIIYDALQLETPAGASLTKPVGLMFGKVTADEALLGSEAAPKQMLHVPLYWINSSGSANLQKATLFDNHGDSQQIEIRAGQQTVDLAVPAVDQATWFAASVTVGDQTYTTASVEMKPMRKWIVYVLPHSHHDLGYTDIQPHIREKQMHNLDLALDEITRTKDYPAGAQFVWNAEVLWSMDDYLTYHPEKAIRMITAIRDGKVYPDGWYANELTGLCRPEELLNLTAFGLKLEDQTGVPIDSAMISDVPGLSWGCVQALNEAGIRYLSAGPNYFDRIGHTLVATEDKPFYWVSASGNNKVLVWTPWQGYSLAPEIGPLSGAGAQERLIAHLNELEENHYPYDTVYIRWDGFGDNAEPDDSLAPFVKNWNETHVSPRFVICNTSQAFHAFEDRYGKQLPTLRGDFTPYWEDGSGSSAHETALNREAAEQLVQAETLFALLNPRNVPTGSFYSTWRDVILYDEHTWGASDSISNPDRPGVEEQWKYKQAFAVRAWEQSSNLLQKAGSSRGNVAPNQFDIFNTCNWTRSDIVTLSQAASVAGDQVIDSKGNPVPSQRLGTGELVFLAKEIPPLAAKRFMVVAGPAATVSSSLRADKWELANDWLTLKLDAKSGGITEWMNADHPDNLIDNSSASLNDYVYVLGAGLEHVEYAGIPTITVKESGPLVASVLVQGNAAGAKSLSREIRIYRDFPRIDIIDNLEKTDVRDVEAGHIAFPFHLPDGQIRLDSQFAVTRPELDQIPGANKNWFPVSRWADISSPRYGITLATLDAPLVEVGGITATLPRTQSDPNAFRPHVDPTQTIYSWIFNNHWETNYKASQHGMLTFRYSLQTHHAFHAMAASRFGIERSQPLVVLPARADALTIPRMTIEPDNLLLTSFKVSSDGKAWIARLFNPTDTAATAQINWAEPQPSQVWRSNLSEKPLEKINGSVTVPSWSLLTVRADF
ncbi:MAG: polysaccharide lyase family protein [Verrucomicrobiota bacterium]